jgi:CRISPR/Cas system CSM-associated protein Csm2 small subunit
VHEVNEPTTLDDVLQALKEIQTRLVRIETRMIRSFEALGVDSTQSKQFLEATRKHLRIEERN